MAVLLNIICCTFLVAGAMAGVPFTDCGSVQGKITNVQISGCTTPPCMLKRNTNVTFIVAFNSNEVASKLTAVVHGIIASVPVPFPIDQANACQESGLTCPIAAGSSYTYHSKIFVKEAYPSLKLPVKWELKDENQKDVFCMVVLVEITS